MFRKLPAFILVLMASLLITAMSGLALAQEEKAAATANDQALFGKDNAWAERIKKSGQLRVGFDTFKPWAMLDKNGQHVGFEIDVAKRLAQDLGVDLKLAPTSWDGIIPALLNGKFDILIGGLGITKERAEKVAFTEPYEYSGIAIVANREKAKGFSALEDFNKPEVIIVAKIGTTAAAAAKELFPKAKLLLFNDEGQTTQELKNGRAHALLAGAPFPAELALKDPDNLFVPIKGLLTKEPSGMALPPKDKAAIADLNLWIERARTDGWLTKRWEYWFEGNEWEKDLK